MEEAQKKTYKKRKLIWLITIILLAIVLIWFFLTIYNYYRVKTERKPILCWGDTKEIESTNEYSIMCYGPFYKYKEYYYNEDDSLTAREFTLFFKEFDRDE